VRILLHDLFGGIGDEDHLDPANAWHVGDNAREVSSGIAKRTTKPGNEVRKEEG